MAQVAHATAAVCEHAIFAAPRSFDADGSQRKVLHETRDLPNTQEYLDDLKSMRKVCCL